jgi:hypothetical protein
MLHIDAHPDFSIPSGDGESGNNLKKDKFINSISSVNEWIKSSNLIDLLDNEGGIAEFLLPLVYNGHISKGVCWLRSPWSHQISDGNHIFDIGDYNHKSKLLSSSSSFDNNNEYENEKTIAVVTFNEGYYLCEGVARNKIDLIQESIQPVQLMVCNTNINDGWEILHYDNNNNEKIPWILDICLDYFSTRNPFINDLYDSIKTYIDNFVEINLRLNNIIVTNDMRPPCFNDIIIIIKDFYKDLNSIKDNDVISNEYYFNKHKREYELKKLLKCDKYYYNSRIKEGVILNESDNNIYDFLSIVPNNVKENSIKFMEILYCLCPLTRIKLSQIGHLILLPHYVSSLDEINELFDQLKYFLKNKMPLDMGVPCTITIARSAIDQYTPPNEVNMLQERVIKLINELIPFWINKENNINKNSSIISINNELNPFKKMKKNNNEPNEININNKFPLKIIKNNNQKKNCIDNDNEKNEIMKDIPSLLIHDLCEDADSKSYTMFLNKNTKFYCK